VTSTAPPPSLAAALPQYQIGDSIGAGGMGEVYAGYHRPLGRHVAIKQLPGNRAQDPGVAERFDHEARLLARLDHPHIVPVYDYVQTASVRLLVMERLDGGTVWSHFHGRGLTGEQTCAIGLAMLAGLQAAHQAGVLHLDIKPKNLLFTTSGVLKVADFGISQVVSEGATLVTRAGEVLGTPAYIAPEQALGNPLTPAADLYSAGTVLYELLSGALPYETDGGALALLHQHVYADARPITGVAPALAAVVMRSLVRDPRERYRDAEAFAMDLAGAATHTFGPGWLDRAAMPVHLVPRVAGSATTITGSHSRGLPHTPYATLPHATVSSTTVRPTGPPPPAPLTMASLGSATLLPARDMLQPPGSARWPTIGAAAAVLVLVALLALTLGRDGDATDSGTVSVNGGADRTDLTNTIRLAGTAPDGDPITARLRLSAIGVGLGESVGLPVPVQAGSFQAELEPPELSRWLAGGAVTGDIVLERAGAAVASERITIRPAQTPLLSAMGAGSVLMMMFTLAYLESILRSVRRRQLRRSGPVLAAPVGAAFAAAGCLLGLVLTRTEPRAEVLLAGAVLGGVAATLATIARSRSLPGPSARR
jgi:eukaryotic-like serine/threonine-protein kinase